jgi:small-conductance mechanosensitive channel
MMWSEMKAILFWTWITAFALWALATPPALAQGDSAADAGTEAEGGTEGGAEDEDESGSGGDADAPPTEAASDAKRIVRIGQVVELDTQHLRWLRGELRSRTDWFEGLSAEMAELAKERNETRERLEATDADPESDPDEVEALRTELKELEVDYGLFDTQADLALTAEKALREQVAALEEKLAIEKRALGELTGEIEIELPEAPAPTPAPTAQPTEPGKAPPLPLPVPVPAARPPAKKETTSSSTMTTAQLEAHHLLAQAERDVELAKVALAEFVERKQALEQQIEFEEDLSETHDKEVENLKLALEAFEARLQKYRDTDAPDEKIQRLERGVREISHSLEVSDDDDDARHAYIKSLHERQSRLEEEELRVTALVDEKDRAAEKARDRIGWLESPIHPQNVVHWAQERGPRMLLVIAAALFLLLFVRFSSRGIARALVGRRRSARNVGTGRADTLAFSFQSASRVVIVVLGVMLVLQEAGVDITTVLGGAAIIGVAIAFGAQDLMKDYFSGFLILAEDQYQLGDLITIRGITGTVESVNMRVTVLRDLEGRVHFIPNGSIDQVTNRTYGWGRPVFEVPVGFGEDVDRAIETLVEVAKELAQDPDWKGSIIGDPDMLGVDKFTDYGLVIKFMVKTQPDQLFAVRREMLRRITKRFQELGIQITVPQRILVRGDEDTEI